MFIWSAITGFFGAFKLQIIAVLAVLALVGAAYWYFNYSQNKISTLTSENATLKSANETNQKTIQKMQQNFVDIQKKLADLNKEYELINQDTVTTKKNISVKNVNKANKDQVLKTVNATMNDVFRNLIAETQHDSF